MLELLRRVSAQARERAPAMVPEIRLVERCGDAMAGLRPESERRAGFYTEPVNRVAPYSNRTATKELEWAVFAFERKYAHSVFAVGDVEVQIGEEAQAALKGRTLDLVDGKIITTQCA